MRLGHTFRKSVIVTNTETGETLEFPSLTETGKYLGISRISVSKYLLNNTPYKEFLISAKHPSLVSEDNRESSTQSYNTDRIKLIQQPVLLTNEETGEIKEFSSLTEAAKFLNISRGRLWYFLSETVKTGEGTLKGYTITKITDSESKVNRKTSKIEVTNIDTK